MTAPDMPKAVRRALMIVYSWCKDNGYQLTILKVGGKKGKN